MPNGTEAPGLHRDIQSLLVLSTVDGSIPDIAEVVCPNEDVDELSVVDLVGGQGSSFLDCSRDSLLHLGRWLGVHQAGTPASSSDKHPEREHDNLSGVVGCWSAHQVVRTTLGQTMLFRAP